MNVIIKPAALTLGLVAILSIGAALAQDDALPEGFETAPVLKTTETRDGDPIAWPEGTAQFISVIGTIEPGGRTPRHQHPVPVYVYILEGEVELRTEGGDPHTYSAGEAYIEALNRDHQLFNVSDDEARVLVVFTATEGQPTTVASE
ncbi:MAG: cupin domain-containing protein [Halomonas sp.]|uniref:Cupin domain-containing protein n=1 Tax=Halomonas sulfidivorans TaxID=2733488 RepID=A0ABX7WKR6_9GAMM|nr:cupin domain-containing protein [Halomonas sulfidivorans]MDX5376727.1 cupin domain-containing protein [Halomonas sp.]MDX5502383.1 cupin domain-containing protein [Halomonas sp.]QTP60162.1 cupin domain-containing protein [Halomonas sulfidivorans]